MAADRPLPHNLDAALRYAALGWRVLPVRSGSKTPATAHGVHDATCDEATVGAWFERWPSASVAIACGAVSRLVVLDVDGPEGEASLAALVAERTPLPPTLEARTPRGGRHLYFALTKGQTARCSAGKLGPGLDVRGEGGYVVAPPSRHENGRAYQWANQLDPAPLPDWLGALVCESSKNERKATPPQGDAPKIRKGERNATLTSLAGSMRRRGMSHQAIEAALLAENATRCEPSLPEAEVRKIAVSVARYKAAPNANGPGATGDVSDDDACGPYAIEDGHIVFHKLIQHDHVVSVPLANFAARIAGEIVLDDGRETSRAFQIEGALASGKPLPTIRVRAEKFSPMNWVAEQWGARAVVGASQGVRDRLREAIQRLSADIPTHRVFTHTGWVRLDGKWIFLSASGAIGQEGVEVDLPMELRRYALPPVVENSREAMALSLCLLNIAPLTITAPLWAAIFRAPIASVYPADRSLFLEGPTGALKSTLAALFLCHFGGFERTSLPGAWSSTVNQLEHRAFVLKDTVFVVDDYAPSPLDVRELESKAARLLRAQGNLAGRGRLRSDLSEQPAYPPRGLIISTGEQHPSSQSVLARTLIIRLEPGALNLATLTEAQRVAACLSHAMAAYVGWLAPQMDNLPKLLGETFTGARERAHREAQHLRVPEALAHLWLGVNSGLQFAEEVAAVSHQRAEELGQNCWAAFLQLGEEQSRVIKGERPSRRFLEVLVTLLVQGRAVVLLKGQAPDEKLRADFLGWYDADSLFLLPDAAFQAVSRFCRESGELFPVRRERLLRDMKREGISECESGHTTTNARIQGQVRRVLCIRRVAAEKLLGEELHVGTTSVPDVPTF